MTRRNTKKTGHFTTTVRMIQTSNIYIYIYIFVCVCVCAYTYIYIHIYIYIYITIKLRDTADISF